MFNIEQFVHRNFDYSNYGNPVSDLRVDCPKCDDSKKHLYISLNKQAVHCFKCGYSANWIDFIITVTGYPYWKAIGELYEIPRMVDYPSKLEKATKNGNIKVMQHEWTLPEDFQNMTVGDGGIVKLYRKYLMGRGFGSDYWTRYNIGYAESVPGRVIIPIDKDYWQGRAISDSISPKYLNPKEPGRDVIFNRVALQRYEEIAITEGAFSAMAIGDNAVALIRKDPTVEQTDRILGSIARRFIIALEPGAFGTMQKIMEVLRKADREVIIWKYSVGDPNDPNGVMEAIPYNLKVFVSMGLNL